MTWSHICLLLFTALSILPPQTKHRRYSLQVGGSRGDEGGVKCWVESRMSQGLWGAVRKVSINTLSSAAGTGAVLGVHSAFVPSDSAPRVTDSQLFNPTFETNKSLIDLQLGEGGTYFAISLRAVALALVGICVTNYCRCGPKARKARR